MVQGFYGFSNPWLRIAGTFKHDVRCLLLVESQRHVGGTMAAEALQLPSF